MGVVPVGIKGIVATGIGHPSSLKATCCPVEFIKRM